MMFRNDYDIDTLILHRQDSLIAEARRNRAPRTPSALRVAIGLALIRTGEHLRGCAQASSEDAAAPAIPAFHLQPVHQA